MEEKFEEIFVKFFLTEEEKKDVAAEMAEKVVTMQQTEDEIKAIKSDYKSQIDSIQASINNAASKLTSGYEMRRTKCQVVENTAKRVFEYINPQTGEITKTTKMKADDLQTKIM